MANQTRQLSSAEVFANLNSDEIHPDALVAYAWRSVARAETTDDLQVALDFAEENQVIPSDVVNLMRPGKRRVATTPACTNGVDGSELIYIRRGPFVVGRDKQPASCEGFFLARHPVTNMQFSKFITETGYAPTDVEFGEFLGHWTSDRQIPPGLDDHPVVFVSLFDALQYCRWAGLMLPPEYLWEKAARGPEGWDHPWGNSRMSWGINYGSRQRKLTRVQTTKTCPVGSYPETRSPYGCEDLVGNVSEWCLPGSPETAGEIPVDWPVDDPAHPQALEQSVVRGSPFMRRSFIRMVGSHRRLLASRRRNEWVGFRPALLPTYHPMDD